LIKKLFFHTEKTLEVTDIPSLTLYKGFKVITSRYIFSFFYFRRKSFINAISS